MILFRKGYSGDEGILMEDSCAVLLSFSAISLLFAQNSVQLVQKMIVCNSRTIPYICLRRKYELKRFIALNADWLIYISMQNRFLIILLIARYLQDRAGYHFLQQFH